MEANCGRRLTVAGPLMTTAMAPVILGWMESVPWLPKK